MDGLLETLIGPLRIYAAAGLVVSLSAHVAALLGYRPGGDALFFALHVGIFPLWLAVVFAANRITGGAGLRTKRFWGQAMSACPEWMKRMTQAFFVYAPVNFAYFFVTASHVKSAQAAPDASVWRGFSGHWMAFYSAGLAILTSAQNIGVANLARKCPRGHPVGWQNAFCPTCGAALRKPAP